MTDQQHPITPPPDLVEQWLKEFYGAKLQYVAEASIHLAARATQWGADKELEACCEWLHDTCVEDPEDIVPELRAARRPNPPSLREQALQALGLLIPFIGDEDKRTEADTIRRALEQLDD
jgi:hypothetical protein